MKGGALLWVKHLPERVMNQGQPGIPLPDIGLEPGLWGTREISRPSLPCAAQPVVQCQGEIGIV